ncbi:MAG: alpha/beta hydrolase, partial [Clostridia bacterium]|nr:alpha/beta hydrolase [Clostridia bacterium]
MEPITLYGGEPDIPFIYYPAENKKTDMTVIVLPGGGYTGLADHEGKGYAEFLNAFGIDAFVLYYRVAPNYFPKPLLDARRAVRYVRANAERYGINPNKI